MTLTRACFAAVAMLALIASAGCGSNQRSNRKQLVNEYIKQVDAAEGPLLAQVGQIDSTFGKFSVKRNPAVEIAALVHARAAIGAALRRVKAIAPPPDAAQLHGDIVALLQREDSVAAELVTAARFGPRFTVELRPLVAAAAGLGRDLAAVKARTPTPSSVKPSGAQIWTAVGCGACHTLASSRSNGTAGPDLDQLRPTSAVVTRQVESGGSGMPSYRRALTSSELAALASYVAAASRGTLPPAAAGGGTVAAENAALFAGYAGAFGRYRRTVASVEASVNRLEAPPLLRPGLVAERRALARSLLLCRKIELDFSRHQAAKANADIKALYGTVAGVASAKVRAQQNAATRAYETELEQMRALATRIAVARQKLVTRIG